MNRKGEKTGNSRSLPRKLGSRGFEGIKSVRQEAKKSPARRRGNGRGSDSSDRNGYETTSQWSEKWDSNSSWNRWDAPNLDANNSRDDWRTSDTQSWTWHASDTSNGHQNVSRVCEYFQSGQCHWGNSCYFSHDWSADAGIVFLLAPEASDVLMPPWRVATELSSEGTGPMRVRIVGDTEDLGLAEGQWDPNLGIDLCWEGDGWRSMVIPLEPESIFHFCVVRVDQPESHPGLLQGWRRWEMHEARHFTWSQKHRLQAPSSNEILEVHLSGPRCAPSSLQVLPRQAVTTGNRRCPWQAPGMKCYTFDAEGGFVLKYCLYLPDCSRMTQESLTLVLFLHSMHGKLEGDNNLFFESDTPLRLLLDEDEDRCPQSLRERCILLAPQCPTDRERGDGAGIWLRKGWYEESDYDHQAEAALMALVEMIRVQYDVRRVSLCGSSMGAYGALELASRRANYFSAVALIAAHYDLDPIEPLVTRLTEKQEVPLWFIHAENDNVCPFEDMEELMRRLKARSRAEVHMTSFEDTWSSQGHCADCVAFWARPVVPGALALGEELFDWLTGNSNHFDVR